MIDPTILSKLTVFLTSWGAAFIITLWLSLVFWSFRDIRSRTGDKFMQILSILIVTVLFLPGVLVYLILRPKDTIEEEYQKSIEEEALLHTIESSPHCPGCGKARWSEMDGLPRLSYPLEKDLPPLQPADGASMEHLPLLRHPSPRHEKRGPLPG